MKTVIIILGGPNDENGILSSVARERCEQALKEYQKYPGARILATGGRGAHFNTTSKPHACYVREYLEARGIPGQAFVEAAESSSTIEDAKLSHPIVQRHGFSHLVVVTSDFHLARARFLFEQQFKGVSIEFSGSQTELSPGELRKRILHEETALARLKENNQRNQQGAGTEVKRGSSDDVQIL